MAVRYFALISGVIFIAIGFFGFVPGMVIPPSAAPALIVHQGYGYLLTAFPVNILHNLVHLAVGAWGVLSYRSYIQSRIYSRGLAIFYAVLAVMGLFPVLNTTFGLIPIFGNDIWLHALTAVIAAFFGFRRPTARDRFEKERELTTGRLN